MKKIKSLFANIKSNYELKSFLSSSFSFLINVVFLSYNLIIGIIYGTIWNWSISVYYALLVVFRAIILFKEKIWKKENGNEKTLKRQKLFKSICWCMIFMDLSLIAPITLMTLSKRSVNLGLIPAIAIATYTTYKIILAIFNFTKKKSKINLSIRALRLITLKDAIVSILTLQNTLIMVLGEGTSMLTLSAISSAGVIIILIAISIIAIKFAYNQN